MREQECSECLPAARELQDPKNRHHHRRGSQAPFQKHVEHINVEDVAGEDRQGGGNKETSDQQQAASDL